MTASSREKITVAADAAPEPLVVAILGVRHFAGSAVSTDPTASVYRDQRETSAASCFLPAAVR